AEKKLKDLSWYDDEVRDLTKTEIETLLNGGEIKKELSNSEKLVLEQYLAEKLKFQKGYEAEQQKLIDNEVNRTENRLKAIMDVQDTEMATEITRLTELHKADLAEAKSQEERIGLNEAFEIQLYNIKTEYAKKSLNEHTNAIQALLDQTELSD